MARTVVIDCFPASAGRYVADHAVVAVDVIRATTLVVTAVAEGRRCLLASSLDDAFALRSGLGDALLAGELAGEMPEGFDMNNSPASLSQRRDARRPVVSLSTSGTELMLAASPAVYGALAVCLRNIAATAQYLADSPAPIAVIGAGSRGEFRVEDQLCCAWLARELVRAGRQPADRRTARLIERWSGAEATAIDAGHSVGYLRRSDQLHDRDFIVSHIDDLDLVCVIEDNEVRGEPPLEEQPGDVRPSMVAGLH